MELNPTWKVRLATAGLWLLIALAAAGGLRGLLPAPTSRAAAPPMPNAPGALGGFAELFVAAYLEAGSGQEQNLKPFYPGPVNLEGVAPAGRYASRTASVGVAQAAPGYWSITVGAEVLVASQGGYVRAGTHYYRVGVLVAPEGPVATSLPGEVPAPKPGGLTPVELPNTSSPSDDAPTQVVRHFFEAYLAGRGELGAYATKTGSLTPVAPPPFASATLTGISFGPTTVHGARLVQARITGADASGLKQVLDYSLRLSDRQGGWAVEEILPAAPLAGGPRH